MRQYLWRPVEDGKIVGGPQVRPADYERQTWIEWLPNMVDDQRKPGEDDAGSDSRIEGSAVIQTLRSQPAAQRDPEVVQAEIMAEAQRRLDAFALARGYDDMARLITYRGDPDPTFAAEAEIGLLKRSQMWAGLRDYKGLVMSGQAPMPTSLDDVPGLPELKWGDE